MHADAATSVAGQTQAGSVVGLWRYPVKSMMGEELNARSTTANCRSPSSPRSVTSRQGWGR